MNLKLSDLFATLWPVVILLTLYALFAPLFSPFINLFLLFFLIFAADMSAFYLYRAGMQKRDNPFFMLLRFFVFYLAAAWIIYKLASGEFLSRNYTPLTAGSLTVLSGCAAGWGMTTFFARALVSREKLIILFSPFDKKELAAKTRQYSYELQEMKLLTEKIRLYPLVFTIISLIVLLSLSLFSGRIFTYQVVTVLGLLVFCLSFIFYTRGMDEELLLLSEGIRLKEKWLSLKGRRFFLILLLLALPSLIVSRIDFTLPFSLIEDFFSWLGSLFTLEPRDIPALPEMPRLERSAPPARFPLLPPEAMEPRTPLFSDSFKELMKKCLIGTGIGAFILFLLLFPFLTRVGRGRSTGLLREGLGEIARYFARLGKLVFGRPGKDRGGFRKAVMETGRKARKEKRKAPSSGESHDLPSAGKVLRTFRRLCRWGEKRELSYETGLSPSEYVKNLSRLVPRRKEDFDGMALFLDHYFYSARIIDADEIDDFIRLAGLIIKEEKRAR